MVLSTLGRLIWVPIAFVLAGLSAAFFLVTLGLERVTQAIHGRGDEATSIPAMIDMMGQALVLTSGLTLVPAVLLVIVGEVARIRSSLYYIIGGGLALVAVPLLARIGQGMSGSAILPPTLVWQVFATAGFLGGWVYWLLAGRRA
jgi:hypothetical protein